LASIENAGSGIDRQLTNLPPRNLDLVEVVMSLAEAATSSTRNQQLAGMLLIPGGTFRMGSDRHYTEEAPVHRITVSSFDQRNRSARCRLLLSPPRVGSHWVVLAFRDHLDEGEAITSRRLSVDRHEDLAKGRIKR
jgi:hypothetical protein